MGGSIQGVPLSLSGTASTTAGLALTGSADGTGSAARFNLPNGVATDGTNLYVADTNNHTIRKVEIATGAVTTLAGTAGARDSTDGTGAAARFSSPYGIATDGISLFVADSWNSTIRKVTISTGAVTTLAGSPGVAGSTDGTGAAARFSYPYGIATDGTNVYVADTYNHTIRQIVIATGAVTTLAGTAGVSGSTDGTGAAAGFNLPYGVATDGTNLFVADTENHTIRKVVIATGAVTTPAGTAGAFGSADGTGADARFRRPYGIARNGTDLYVADNYNHTIRKVAIATGAVTTPAGTAGATGSADGTGADARFVYPCGIAADGANVYLADGNSAIRKMGIATGTVATLAGPLGSIGSADGTGSVARYYYPYGITTDGTNLFVADSSNHTIRKIVIDTGAVTTFAGAAGVSGSADGTGAAARFSSSYGVTTDGTNLFVADTSNRTIRKVAIATGAVTTLAGTAGASGSTDGTGAAARFNSPRGITTDGTNLFVADRSDHTIRKIIIATGAVTTFAGAAGVSGSADGTGAAARFSYPNGITTDGTDLYVADSSNNAIRKVAIASGGVTTLAGGAFGDADGTGAAARFNYPCGITTDGTSLYVADSTNNTVRKVAIATGAVTTLAGTGQVSGSADAVGSGARFNFPYGITTDGKNLYLADSRNNTIRKVE
jgi:sugar lactone lactonase YvrE